MAERGNGMQSPTADEPGRRCLLWIPPERAAPSRLLAGLARRDVPATVLSDAPSVMHDLSLPGRPPRALIVVEPERQPHLRELLAAVRTYHPKLAVWQYRAGPVAEGGGLSPLGSLEGAPAEAGPRPARESADTTEGGNTSAVHAEPSSPERRHTPPADDTAKDEAHERRALRLLSDEPRDPTLTAEELEMLLGPLPHEEPPRP